MQSFFYIKKVCSQGFNDILTVFHKTFFNRIPKIITLHTSSLWANLYIFSWVHDCITSFRFILAYSNRLRLIINKKVYLVF